MSSKNILLVSGLLSFNSGKTSVALSIASSAIKEGIDTGVCKPVTALSAWYQYRCVLKSMELKKLVGEDIYRLHKAVNSSDKLEIESPLVFLHSPLDPERIDWNPSVYTAIGLSDLIVVYRMTDLEKTRHFMVIENVNRLTGVMREKIDMLLNSLDPPPEKLEKFLLDDILLQGRKIADECVRYLAEKHDLLVVESYNNASAPTQESLNANRVVVVAPGKIAVYEGKKYKKALFAISDIKEPWRITVDEVVSLLKPEMVIETPPSPDGRVILSLRDILEI